jgi:hypothetical protein
VSARRLAQIALLAVVVVTLVIVLRPQGQEKSVATSVAQSEPLTGTTYVAYYFHGNVRCDTCRSIEAQAEAAVKSGFPEELADGTLEWQVVNTDQPENTHFTEDFDLTHSTVVLLEREGNETRRFTSLDRVWELVHDEDDSFRNYVQGEIANWVRADS